MFVYLCFCVFIFILLWDFFLIQINDDDDDDNHNYYNVYYLFISITYCHLTYSLMCIYKLMEIMSDFCHTQDRDFICLNKKLFQRSTNPIYFTAPRRTPLTVFSTTALIIAWAEITCCLGEEPILLKLQRKLINIPVIFSLL